MNFLPERTSQDEEHIKGQGEESETARTGLMQDIKEKMSEYAGKAQETRDGVSGSISAKWKQAMDAVKNAYGGTTLENVKDVEENVEEDKEVNAPDILNVCILPGRGGEE